MKNLKHCTSGIKNKFKTMDNYKELQQAALQNNLRKAKYLLEQGIDLTGASLNDFFKFYSFERHIKVPEKMDLLQLFLKAGVDVNLDRGETLSKAISHGYEKMAHLLLDAGTEVQSPFGQFSLIYAAEHGFLELVKKILDAGADINDEDLLYSASRKGRVDVVKYLLECGAGKDFPEDIDNALEGAVMGGRLNIVKILLKNGANPMANNERAIRLAVEMGNLNIAHVLYKLVYSTENNKD